MVNQVLVSIANLASGSDSWLKILGVQKFKIISEIFNNICDFKLSWSFERTLRARAPVLIYFLLNLRVENRLLLF